MPLRDDLLAPIPGANPSGKNLKYDKNERVFDAIKEARREDIDVPQGDWKVTLKTADWFKVVQLAGDALAAQSKDLQIAGWLLEAYVRREGFQVLAPGFAMLQGLLVQFWETLYPGLEDGDAELRARALEWLGNKLPGSIVLVPITSSGLAWSDYKQSRIAGFDKDANTDVKRKARQQAIHDGKPTAEDYDDAVNGTPREFYEGTEMSLAAAIEALQKLNELCEAKFKRYAPSFENISSLLAEILQMTRSILKNRPVAVALVVVEASALSPVPQQVIAIPAPAVAASVVIAQVPSQAAAPQLAVSSTSGDPDGLEDAIRRAGDLCRWLREKTIYDAAAYLIVRAFRWGELRAKAPDILPSMLEAPSTDVRSGIKQLFLEQSWTAVLDATERAMLLPCGRAWLDLQRYAIQSLEAKGQYYKTVAVSIRKALRDLLEEFPTLIDQTLSDGTPVADPETRAWISEFVLGGEPAGQYSPLRELSVPVITPPPSREISLEKPLEIEPEEQVPGDVFDQALAAARANHSAEALDLIYKQLTAERTGRGRFRRRTQLAHLLMVSGHEKIASPILRELAQEIEQRRLDDWERGEALAYPMELLIRCLDSNGADPADRKQLFDRLCRLDPVRALQWSAD